MKPDQDLMRRVVAEFVGTMFLLIAVVGSGIMAQSLTDDIGLQLLQNAVATGGALFALIMAVGPVSGAHFNPVVNLLARYRGELSTTTAAAYIPVQIVGSVLGVVVANIMFDLDAVTWSQRDRSSVHLLVGEVVATVGLLVVIAGIARSGSMAHIAGGVGAYITGAYYFTSSTSFANPAVTIGRTFSDTFAGIEPASAPAFIGAQFVGLVIAGVVIEVMFPRSGRS